MDLLEVRQAKFLSSLHCQRFSHKVNCENCKTYFVDTNLYPDPELHIEEACLPGEGNPGGALVNDNDNDS